MLRAPFPVNTCQTWGGRSEIDAPKKRESKILATFRSFVFISDGGDGTRGCREIPQKPKAISVSISYLICRSRKSLEAFSCCASKSQRNSFNFCRFLLLSIHHSEKRKLLFDVRSPSNLYVPWPQMPACHGQHFSFSTKVNKKQQPQNNFVPNSGIFMDMITLTANNISSSCIHTSPCVVHSLLHSTVLHNITANSHQCTPPVMWRVAM